MEDFDEELEQEQKHYDNHPWRKIFKTVFKHKGPVIGLLISVFFLALLDTLYPFINKYALDNYFGENPVFDNIHIFMIFYIVVAILYGFTIFSFIFFAGKVEVNTSYELRKEAYLNLQKLPFSYFDRTAQGWIMARLTSDSRKLSEIISWGVVDLLWGLLTMLGILGILMVLNIKLALIILIILPIILGITIFINSRILKAYRSARKENSKITAALNEGFMGANAT